MIGNIEATQKRAMYHICGWIPHVCSYTEQKQWYRLVSTRAKEVWVSCDSSLDSQVPRSRFLDILNTGRALTAYLCGFTVI